MDLRNLIAFSPAGQLDPSIPIAACRAGARGGLDLEHVTDAAAAWSAVQKLELHGRAGYGLKIGRGGAELLPALLEKRPGRLAWVLLAGGDWDGLAGTVDTLQRGHIEVLLEATSIAEVELAERLGVDGVVLKGNESGGRVGDATAFILLQQWQKRAAAGSNGSKALPAWVQGGIGKCTAAACAAAGATGVVLDNQLLLTRESPLRKKARAWLAAFDGSETLCLGTLFGEAVRIHKRPGSKPVERLTQEEERLDGSDLPAAERLAQWRAAVDREVRGVPVGELLLLGQDACFADSLAQECVTVSGVLQAIVKQVRHNLDAAQDLRPLDEDAPLAASHGTRFPILQGPMTRVSDTAEFANHVACAGALPFLALAVLRKKRVEQLLAETKQLLGDKPWGVGLLGFLPPEIRKEQTDAVLANKPPFALIAGGRPDQAKEFEDQGIPTYLHVPSPGLLTMFLKDGARRFIFEGRECGGHVGPRGSFLLWETMCGLLLKHLGPSGRGDNLHIVFAGGIHDAVSAAAVSALAAPLAERGVKVGVLMGTAYLFTQEAVAGGAIVPRFQKEAISTQNTVLLETGPGHAIRCINSPYFEHFNAEKRRLRAEGKSKDEITRALEWMNMGRLRVASKGIERVTDETGTSTLAEIPEDEQFARGMYMIGQVAAMHEEIITMAELHEDVSLAGTRRIEALAPAVSESTPNANPCDVAVIGMSCFYPGSVGLEGYWENILNKVYAVTEVPETHWDWRLYYDPDPMAKDKIVSKWGGFMQDVPFEPLRYGITPKSMDSIEPLQMLLLEGVRLAIEDAGYTDRPFNREKTCAVLGIGGGGAPLAVAYGFRACLPLFQTIPGLEIDGDKMIEQATAVLPEWTEDSFPGFLHNVAVGRIANRYDFGGMNMAIDAACASSLAAIYDCVRELQTGASDVAIAMGADTVMTPYAFTAFSKTHALSRRGRCSPFDASGDGIALAEGIGVVMLKRLADAERDGDTIYGVIKGMGSSSDGREKGLTAPNITGQVRALRRAYESAGINPSRVGLIEAHGTGTVVGDSTEATALINVYREAGAGLQSTALGSVKSMIGHTKCAAGIGGLIKTAKALHHKVLPPTLVEQPNPRINFGQSPLYLNADARPWIHGADEPRCGAVSAFGFGGTNFHLVLEEYTGEYRETTPPAQRHWPAELFTWRRASRADIARDIEKVQKALAGTAQPEMGALARSLWKANTSDPAHPVLAIVAASLDDLMTKMRDALEVVQSEVDEAQDPRGIYFASQPAGRGGKVAFLFPGQGSQYPNMLAQVGINFPEVRETFDQADRTLFGKWEKGLGRYVYPPSTFSPEEDRRVAAELANTEVAQPALGAAGLAMFRLLSSLGIEADFLAGHSYGEYVALCAAGAMSAADLFRVSYERGRLVNEASGENAGGMVALDADAKRAAELIEGIEGVWLANLNSPNQTVVSGTEDGIKALLKRVQDQKARGRRIPVACAFHSPLVAEAGRPLAKVLSDIEFTPPVRPVFSNSLAAAYPQEPDKLASVLADHLGSSVRWQPEIEAMAEAGARVFVEVGPQGVLTGLVKQVLADRPHVAVATDLKGRGGLVQLQHCLAQLLVSGVPMDLDRLYRDRDMDVHDLSRLEQETSPKPIGPLTYLVNGVRAKLYHDPEPYVLGQRMKDNPPSANGGPPPQPAANGQRHSGAATTNGAAHAAPPHSNGHDSNGHANHGAPAAANGNSHLPTTNGAHTLPSVPAQPMQQAQYMPAPQPAPTYLPAVDEATYVMQGFQSVMGKFLDTQRSVMLSYLQGGEGHAAPASHAVHPAMPMPQPMHYPMPQQPMPQPMPQPAPQPMPQQPQQYAPAPQPAAPAPQAEAPAAPVAAPQPAAAEPKEPQTAMTRPNEPKPVAKAEKAGGVPSREEMAEQLLDLVSGRTGYPKEMLGLDLDLEGELGIDSIKRVEILGTLAEGLGTGDEEDVDSKLDLEQLTSLRTLRGILDYLDEALRNPPQPAPSVEDVAGTPNDNGTGHAEGNGTPGTTHQAAGHVAESDAPVTGDEHLEVMRGLVRLIDAPLPSGAGAVVPTGTVVVTDDGRGVALELASRLADFDVNVTIVRMAAPGAKGWTADLTDPAAVAELIGRIREEAGPIGGLIHLMPLAAREAGDDWAARAHRDTKSLYLLARELETDLRAVGEDGGALLIAATAMGGTLGFGDGPLPETFSAGDGGVIGFAKCLGSEWPEVMVRVIDLDPAEAGGDLADHVLAELNDPEGPLEIGRRGTQRVTWQPYKATLDTTSEPNLTIPDGATILVTGGARGITARIVEELAQRHKPNVVLVGRSPLPPETEDPATAGIEGPAEIKAVFIKRMQASGEQFTPAAVEKQYQRLLQDREIRGNLQRIRAAGATVHYRQVDVRDEAAMTALFAELKETFGGVDGVIHGAGVIDDKLVKDKTLESFDRVFGTKVDSAALIARHLDPQRLKFCVFFASIASRYGNRGQSDYAAANEVLSKLAHGLNRRMPGRVTAVCWGPWGGIGMVSHLEKHLIKRGLKLIPPAVGAKMLADELLYGSKDQTEVLIAGGEEHEMSPRHSRQRIGQQPAPASAGT